MQRKFLRDFLICFIPCLIAGILVFRAYQKYERGEGGFKLGIDLVGGTILVYEVDQQREKERRELSKGQEDRSFTGEKTSERLAEAIKRRIDPDDVKNIIVRTAGEYRIEVILPTGSHRKNAEGKKNVNAGEVEKIKTLIEEVGSLEFRIVANKIDDQQGIAVAQELYPTDQDPEALKQDSAQWRVDAIAGRLPRAPFPKENETWYIQNDPERKARYAWVELGTIGRADFGLLNKYDPSDPRHEEFVNKVREKPDLYKKEAGNLSHNLWGLLADARAKNAAYQDPGTGYLFYSRPCLNSTLSAEERAKRKYEYFILTRISERVEVDGTKVTVTARPDTGQNGKPVIGFRFNNTGGQEFSKLTRQNKPDDQGQFKRQLAIILNGKLIQAPSINAIIGDNGIIEGDFNMDYVNLIVQQLRSGALPATLKQKPVAENTIGPTLGQDTINSGTKAIGGAYLAVLLFMLVYYRFSGMVACVALLANLLLTIGFMVAVDATFTLPGLAGLVLMLGMAVDANILIYERLREERDRGANLQMAIRNAYDRAFGTIIDTHLTSIFTAIVLYAVGNDQLRGFGISLAVGLVISLFTSLYMTHLMFDFWLKKNWLSKLRMFRFFTRPNIDFMRLRKVMFPITGALTVLGLAVFLLRGEKSLNVDFIGGTVYGGQLNSAVDVNELRGQLSPERQDKILEVADVVWLNEPGKDAYRIIYKIPYGAEIDPATKENVGRRVELALGVEGATQADKNNALKQRASSIPDLAIEQNFLSGDTGDTSRFFTIRTTEKEPQLVQVALDRLFRDEKSGESTLASVNMRVSEVGKDAWKLSFVDPKTGEKRYASEAFVRTLLDRDFRAAIPAEKAGIEPYQLQTDEANMKDGRYSEMAIVLTQEAKDELSGTLGATQVTQILERVAGKYNLEPQPERLEVFDPALAGDTRGRAFIAILVSWLAILLYLWFRFGNWTFGLAAVLCLIHDLCFTIGAIVACHYIHDTSLGRLLGLQDFKIDFAAVAALLTLVGYSVNEIIVNFARVREVRGKSPVLTPQMINDSVNQTISRTVLTATTMWLVSLVLYCFGGSGVHLFAFVMVVGVMIATYSSIYVACPLLLLFGEGRPERRPGESNVPAPISPKPQPVPATV